MTSDSDRSNDPSTTEALVRLVEGTDLIPLVVTRVSDGVVLFATEAASRLLGQPDPATRGLEAGALYARPHERAQLLETLARGGTHTFEIEGRVHGELSWVRLTARLVNWQGERAVALVLHDATEERRAAASAGRRVAIERFIARMNASFLECPEAEVDARVGSTLEAVGGLIGADRARVVRVDGEGFARVTHEWCDPRADTNAPSPDPPTPTPVSLGSLVLQAGVSRAERDAKRHADLSDEGVRVRLSVPIVLRGGAWGYIAVDRLTSDEPWIAPDVSLVELVAATLGRAFERQQAELLAADRTTRLLAQQQALGELTRNPELVSGNLPRALGAITEVAAFAMGVARAGVWLRGGDGQTRLQDRFDLARCVHVGALETLSPLGAGPGEEGGEAPACQLDEPVRFRGSEVGLLRLEQLHEPRPWTAEDRGLAVSLSSIVTLALEIADHKRTRERFAALIESTSDPTLVISDARIVFANDAAAHLVRVARAAVLVGQPLARLVPEGDTTLPAHVTAVLAGARHRGPPTGRVRRFDTTECEVEVAATPMRWDDRPAVQLVVRDVSERTAITAKMMAMDRMIAVGTLAAGVGHEINNPLTYLLSNVETAREDLARLLPALPEAARGDLVDVERQLAEACDGARRIRDIVRDLKTFSRSSDEEHAPVPLVRVVESALSMARGELRHRARISREYRDEPTVVGHDGRLRQVVLNLLINAAQSIAEGESERHEIRVRVYVDGVHAVVEVADDGAGIPADLRGRIFDPFFTTKPVGQGTGLGLAISKQIVEGHRGELDFESRLGEGTTFRVRLPATPERALETHESKTPSQGTVRAKVLVIDDEPGICRSVARLLGREHDVTTTTSGREGLASILSGRFDLVLCDLMIPDLSGIEIHAELERDRPELLPRLVFITGGAFTPRAHEFLRRVGNLTLEKPLDARALRACVRERITAGLRC